MMAFHRGRGPRPHDQESPCQTLAVWGPTGAPGRTTVAVGLAGAFRAQGEGETVIVDCDLGRGKVACHLGAPPGNTLVTACALPPPPDQPCAPGHLQRPRRDGPWLLAGVATPAQWPDVEPARLARLLGALRAHYRLIVLDVGAALPPDPRGGAHQVALQAADLVLAICQASPAGLEDFCIQFPSLLATLGPERSTRVGVVLNHVAPEGVTRYRSSLAHLPHAPLLAALPHDHSAVTQAQAMRRPLTQATPRAPIALALCRLAQEIRTRARR